MTVPAVPQGFYPKPPIYQAAFYFHEVTGDNGRGEQRCYGPSGLLLCFFLSRLLLPCPLSGCHILTCISSDDSLRIFHQTGLRPKHKTPNPGRPSGKNYLKNPVLHAPRQA